MYSNPRYLIAAVFGIAALIGCTSTATVTTSTSDSSLESTATAWKQAIDTEDPDRIAAFFAPEAVAMYPHPSPTVGRQANREAWEAVYSEPDAEHPVTVERVEEARSGELGYIYGKWWSWNPAEDYYNAGRYTAIWKPMDGRWQIAMLSANAHEDVKEERSFR